MHLFTRLEYNQKSSAILEQLFIAECLRENYDVISITVVHVGPVEAPGLTFAPPRRNGRVSSCVMLSRKTVC
jgi:hypothetical protein